MSRFRQSSAPPENGPFQTRLPKTNSHGISPPSSREGLAPSPTCRPGKVVPQQGCGWRDAQIEAPQQLSGFNLAPVLLGQPMEDFLYQDALAGQAAELIGYQSATSAGCASSQIWQETAEDCVLNRIKTLRILGGLPRHKRALAQEERLSRLQTLLKLWANGCICAVDEELFADLLYRRNNTDPGS